MPAYYNENDAYAAQWLRNLIAAGHIAPGDVDERSIEDVSPDDLRGYAQCHFFAGIGVWSYALRLAGWPDDRPVWTGSCPCPPFSAAGKGSECPSCGGRSCLSHPLVTAGWLCLDCGDEWRGDDRHLLPEFIRLIGECSPSVTFGEQVASRDGRLWLYTLRSVVETMGHAVGAADTCSAGSGAPHIRQRLRFVAERVAEPNGRERQRFADGEGCQRNGASAGRLESDGIAASSGIAERLAHHHHTGLEGWGGEPERRAECVAGPRSVDSRLGDAEITRTADIGVGNERDGERSSQQFGTIARTTSGNGAWHDTAGSRVFDDGGTGAAEMGHPLQRPGPVNGFWRNADWLFCRDGKWRPVEPGTFPLAHGAPARVGRLRAYGNAIDAQATKHFIQAYIETTGER